MNVYSCTVVLTSSTFHVEILADTVFNAESILFRYFASNDISFCCLYGPYFLRDYVPSLFDTSNYINF